MGFCDFVLFFLSRPKAWMSSVNDSQFESVMFPVLKSHLYTASLVSSTASPLGIGTLKGKRCFFLLRYSKGSSKRVS